MTRDEALCELGLDAASTPDQIRRAYARGVKTRKPEVDPDGFRRLREAYEQLTERRSSQSAPRSVIEWESTSPTEATDPAESSGDEAALFEEADEAAEEPLSLLALAESLAESNETAKATDCMLRALEAGELTQDAARRIMDVILHLQAAGAVVESLRIDHRLQEILAESGQEMALIDGPTAAVWSLLCEILDLPLDFPQEIRAAFARAVAAGDLDTALSDLWSFAGENPEAARAAADQLQCLPLLAAAYRSTYDRVRPPQEEKPRRPRRPPAQISLKDFLLFLALLLAAFAISQWLAPLAR